ncbi:MAG: PAS domain-containing protein [Actinomycetota bacterium]
MNGVDVAQLALLGEAAECLQDVAVFVWDDDRNYVAVNQTACKLVGRTREELLELRVGDLSPNRALPLFEEVQAAGVHHGVMEGPDGELRYVTTRTRVAGLPYMVSMVWRA